MSTVKVNRWLNSDGTENYKCRAWVNFNGTGTIAIRASGNVTSITDNGVGDYTVNFTTAMPDLNYCITFGSKEDESGTVGGSATSRGARFTHTTGSFRVAHSSSGGQVDAILFCVAVFR